MKPYALFLAVCAAGCSWTSFDDLSNDAWAHAQEKPDSDQSDYGVGLVDVGTTGPGTLAVLSGNPPNYSVLTFDSGGSTNETLTRPLGNDTIAALSPRPIFVGDGAGDVTLVDKSIDGPLVAVHGTATQLSDQPLGTTNTADAALYLGSGGEILVTAAGTGATPTSPSAFVVTAGTPLQCDLGDTSADGSGAPTEAMAALATDGANVWGYGRDGKLYQYAIASITGCSGRVAAAMESATAGPPAANGGYLALLDATHAVAVALDSASTMSATATVFDLTTLEPIAGQATPLAAPGARAATFGVLGGMAVLAIGFPTATVGGTESAGEVDLYLVDATTGVHADAAEVLSIPQADSDLVFGRALATMVYNGDTILAVGASNVVYAYYQTALYSNTRQ